MIKVNAHDLIRHFANYLERVKKGERVVVLYRRVPVADMVRYKENMECQTWKRRIEKIQIKGVSLARAAERFREKEY